MSVTGPLPSILRVYPDHITMDRDDTRLFELNRDGIISALGEQELGGASVRLINALGEEQTALAVAWTGHLYRLGKLRILVIDPLGVNKTIPNGQRPQMFLGAMGLTQWDRPSGVTATFVQLADSDGGNPAARAYVHGVANVTEDTGAQGSIATDTFNIGPGAALGGTFTGGAAFCGWSSAIIFIYNAQH